MMKSCSNRQIVPDVRGIIQPSEDQKKKRKMKMKRVKRTEKGSTKYDDLEIVMSKTFEE